MKVPFTVIAPPVTRDGEYLDALERWGALPEQVPIPDVVNLLAHLTKQNPAALRKVILDALVARELRFWGLSGQEGQRWVEGMWRSLHKRIGKPHIRLGVDGRESLKVSIEDRGSLHLEAMAVCPRDVVALLTVRGRKVPDELRHLLQSSTESSEPVPGATEPAPEATDEQRTRWTPELITEARPDSAPRPLTTRDLAEAFDGIRRQAEEWRRLLGDTGACKWAHPARVEQGARGKRPNTWNPVTFALLLEKRQEATRRALRERFRTRAELAEWRDEWARSIGALEHYFTGTDDRQP
jgi:hypothetical protein